MMEEAYQIGSGILIGVIIGMLGDTVFRWVRRGQCQRDIEQKAQRTAARRRNHALTLFEKEARHETHE